MMRVLWVGFLLTLPMSILAQNVHLPVKIDNKWTFLDVKYSSTTIDTNLQFDYIGDVQLPWHARRNGRYVSSGYYLIESDGKLGLVNTSFQPVLAPIWKEIYPISNNLFFVADEGYTVVDSFGTDLLSGLRYEDIRPIPGTGDSLFMVKIDRRWGVHRRGASKMIIPAQYGDIEYLQVGKGLFKIKQQLNDKGWMIMDWSQRLLPGVEGPQMYIMPAIRNYFATKVDREGLWILRDSSGNPKMSLERGKNLRRLYNNTLFAYQDALTKRYTVVVFGDSIRKLDKEFVRVAAVNEELASYRIEEESGLILPDGNLIPLDSQNDLRFLDSEEDLFRVVCTSRESGAKEKWGIYSKSAKEILISCRYDSIGLFYGNLARCYMGDKVGLINRSTTEIIPPRFERIPNVELVGTTVIHCFWKDSSQTYQLTEAGELERPPYEPDIAFGRILGKSKFYGLEYNYRDDVVPVSMRRNNVNTEQPIDDREFITKSSYKETPDTFRINEKRRVLLSKAGYQFQDFKSVTRTRSEKIDWRPGFFQRIFNFVTGRKPRSKWKRTKEEKQKWVSTSEGPGEIWECTDVNWSLIYHSVEDSDFIANDFSTFHSRRDRAQRISILDKGQLEIISGPGILGIRLNDFRQGLPYAAFIDLEGKMGLINKEGKQALDANNRPLRFAYIDRPSEGKIPAMSPNALAKQVYSKGAYSAVKKSFQLRISRKAKPWRNKPRTLGIPAWGYIDAQGETLIPFEYEQVGRFRDSFAIVRKQGKWGVITPDNVARVAFLYDNIQDRGDHWKVSQNKSSLETLFFDFEGRQLPDKKSAISSTRGVTLFPWKAESQSPSYGYKNHLAETVIPPKYEEARHFSEGLAGVKSGGRWHFINQMDSVHIKLDSTILGVRKIFEFSEGLCRIEVPTSEKGQQVGRWRTGYIDRLGQFAIDPVYHIAEDFNNGYAVVKYLDFSLGNGVPNVGMINKMGDQIIPMNYRIIEPSEFETGLIKVILDKNKFGVYGQAGEMVSKGYHSDIQVFQDGFAISDSLGWSIFDLDGNEILFPLEDKPTRINSFTNGHLLVRDSSEWHHYSFDGKKVKALETSFSSVIQPFINDFALVTKADIPFLYHKNQYLVKAPEGRFTAWSGEFATVKTENDNFSTYHYVNRALQNVFQRRFAFAHEFQSGVAMVKKGKYFGAINSRGMFIVPPKFSELTIGVDYIEVKPIKEKVGLIGKNGKELIPVKYDKLIYLNDGLVRVEKADLIGYYRYDGRVIWDPKPIWGNN